MSFEANTVVFTIGHSNHTLQDLVANLRLHGVTAVADIRSSPYSRANPQFNRESFRKSLKANGVAYVFLGNELGGRPNDQSYYVDGRVQYHEIAKSEFFKEGLDRVRKGARSHKVTLLCSEAEPLACHRTILVAQELTTQGIAVVHIHANGKTESHAEAMTRLINTLGLSHQDLYRTKEQIIADACAIQGTRIAYVSGETCEKASA